MYGKELDFLKNTLTCAYETTSQKSVLVSEKASFDVVTNIDQGIEEFFARELSRSFPGDTLHGEEFSPDAPLSGRTWILDPIDGTFNFATGSYHFGLQGALWEGGEIRVSVIYLPKFGEVYTSVKGEGAFLNGKRIFVSKRLTKDAIVSFGDLPHARPKDAARQQKIMECAYEKISRMRMFGAASVDFAMAASGKTEGLVLFTKNKWDIAPGLLLAKEAGAEVYGENGMPYTFDSSYIFVCNRTELYFDLVNDLNL